MGCLPYNPLDPDDGVAMHIYTLPRKYPHMPFTTVYIRDEVRNYEVFEILISCPSHVIPRAMLDSVSGELTVNIRERWGPPCRGPGSLRSQEMAVYRMKLSKAWLTAEQEGGQTRAWWTQFTTCPEDIREQMKYDECFRLVFYGKHGVDSNQRWVFNWEVEGAVPSRLSVDSDSDSSDSDSEQEEKEGL